MISKSAQFWQNYTKVAKKVFSKKTYDVNDYNVYFDWAFITDKIILAFKVSTRSLKSCLKWRESAQEDKIYQNLITLPPDVNCMTGSGLHFKLFVVLTDIISTKRIISFQALLFREMPTPPFFPGLERCTSSDGLKLCQVIVIVDIDDADAGDDSCCVIECKMAKRVWPDNRVRQETLKCFAQKIISQKINFSYLLS